MHFGTVICPETDKNTVFNQINESDRKMALDIKNGGRKLKPSVPQEPLVIYCMYNRRFTGIPFPFTPTSTILPNLYNLFKFPSLNKKGKK